MDNLNYRDAILFVEDAALPDIAAQVGTPCFVYSRASIESQWNRFDMAFGDYPHRIHYAVKANSNLALLNLLAGMGSGFDIVSGGELLRVLEAGGDPARVIFSGVCKLEWEIRDALQADIGVFNIESEGELDLIAKVAEELGRRARISVRINPDVDSGTHPYISTGLKSNKFGMPSGRAMETYLRAARLPSVEIHGIACHIGSQIMDLGPFLDALARVLGVVDELADRGIRIGQIDFGGGLGIRYDEEQPPDPSDYVQQIRSVMESRPVRLPVAIEPGRAIVGNAGLLLTAVHSLKRNDPNRFCIVDAAMNDLLRPALYQAYQRIMEVNRDSDAEAQVYDVVGPVCESGDFLGKDRLLRVSPNDLLAVCSAGAYGSVMSSNYNSRPRPAEVLVDGKDVHVIRCRETLRSCSGMKACCPFPQELAISRDLACIEASPPRNEAMQLNYIDYYSFPARGFAVSVVSRVDSRQIEEEPAQYFRLL